MSQAAVPHAISFILGLTTLPCLVISANREIFASSHAITERNRIQVTAMLEYLLALARAISEMMI